MKNDAVATALITWLTNDSATPIYLILLLLPVLCVLLTCLVIYAVFWKHPK